MVNGNIIDLIGRSVMAPSNDCLVVDLNNECQRAPARRCEQKIKQQQKNGTRAPDIYFNAAQEQALGLLELYPKNNGGDCSGALGHFDRNPVPGAHAPPRLQRARPQKL